MMLIRRHVLLAFALPLCMPAMGFSQSAAPAPPVSQPADLLQPGDIVRLKIWREPDLSGDFQVDENGSVVFPKIGVVEVRTESLSTLRDRLQREYLRFLINPSIDIIFLRRVTVLGAVRHPGLYPADPTMTVAEVVAMAGGTTPEGKPDKIDLLRDGKRVEAIVTQRTLIRDLAIRSGDQLYVPERSWASRNTALLASVVSATVSLGIALLLK